MDKNQKLYDPAALSEKPLAKVGTRIDAEITKINSGKLGDYISEEILDKWENGDAEALAIEIFATCTDGSIRRKTMQVPETDQVHPNSNLAKWRNAYGDYPHIGQKIFLTADMKGFYQFQK